MVINFSITKKKIIFITKILTKAELLQYFINLTIERKPDIIQAEITTKKKSLLTLSC
jgi:hypothetical protein